MSLWLFCAFPQWLMRLNTFYVLICHPHIFWNRVSIPMFCLSLVGQFILLLWVQRVLDIFKSFVSYETHKKPICGFLFHPLPVSLGEPRFLILLKSNFSFFFLLWTTRLVSYWRNSCLILVHKDFLLSFLLEISQLGLLLILNYFLYRAWVMNRGFFLHMDI